MMIHLQSEIVIEFLVNMCLENDKYVKKLENDKHVKTQKLANMSKKLENGKYVKKFENDKHVKT